MIPTRHTMSRLRLEAMLASAGVIDFSSTIAPMNGCFGSWHFMHAVWVRIGAITIAICWPLRRM